MKSFVINYVIQERHGQGFVHRKMTACGHQALMRMTFRLRELNPVYVWVTEV